jgi:NAD(P)-dependent dehydrogenase (short-subunit alcohol dehydrogenase family)
MGERRVAIVSDAAFYVGPDICRLLAQRGHDLVIGDPPRQLVDELSAMGVSVEPVEGVRDLAEAGSAERLVQSALDGVHRRHRRRPVPAFDRR